MLDFDRHVLTMVNWMLSVAQRPDRKFNMFYVSGLGYQVLEGLKSTHWNMLTFHQLTSPLPSTLQYPSRTITHRNASMDPGTCAYCGMRQTPKPTLPTRRLYSQPHKLSPHSFVVHPITRQLIPPTAPSLLGLRCCALLLLRANKG